MWGCSERQPELPLETVAGSVETLKDRQGIYTSVAALKPKRLTGSVCTENWKGYSLCLSNFWEMLIQILQGSAKGSRRSATVAWQLLPQPRWDCSPLYWRT